MVNGGRFWRAALFWLALLLAIAFGMGTRRPHNAVPLGEPYPWAFLRNGLPIAPGEKLVELAAVGDVNLGRGVDPAVAFNSTSGWLQSAGLALINLECVITVPSQASEGSPAGASPIRLIAPPGAARAIQSAGIDVVGLANNHSLDGGPRGLEDTVRYLEKAGVSTVGAGPDEENSGLPLIRTVDGVTIAFLAFNAVPTPDPRQPGWVISEWEQETSLAAVRRAAILADGVVVSIHWGYEFDRRADPGQWEIAQALIAAGADLVIGHHPHVTQEVLVQRRADGSSGLAALSLGNFVFDQGQGGSRDGLGLRASFDRDGLRAVQLLPVQAGPQPRLNCKGGPNCPDSPLPAVKKAASPTKTARFTCQNGACSQTVQGADHEDQSSGIFRSGQIDLTGDHLAEEIRLEDHRVKVYEQGKLAWMSPEEWRVLDLTLGDPDADGRGDLVLALEKPNRDGQAQSHPFVIGYRGGVYRTVWGGSAVADPVKEVELGDVDGDGKVELIVLEENRRGQGRAVTVWRWHGWGFSLDWRSPFGQYENMRFADQMIAVQQLR